MFYHIYVSQGHVHIYHSEVIIHLYNVIISFPELIAKV